MCRVLEHFILPVYVRINQWITTVNEFLQLTAGISRSKTIVLTSTVQSIGVVVGTDHICHLRVELNLMRSTHLEMVLAVFSTVLGLYQQHAIDGFMTVESYSGRVFQHGNTFHLFYRKTVDGSFHTINKNQDISLTCGLYATDVKRSATTFLAFETSVLKSIQTRELAIEGISQTDG